jgi:hypothetical protein
MRTLWDFQSMKWLKAQRIKNQKQPNGQKFMIPKDQMIKTLKIEWTQLSAPH